MISHYYRRGYLLLAALLSVVVAGCSSAPQIPDSVYQFDQLESVKRVQNYRLDGWVTIDNRSLIVRTSPSKSYLFVLAYPNNDLKFKNAIAISSTAGSVQVNFDTVSVIQGGSSVPVVISTIYKLDSRDQEKEIIAEINSRREKAQTVADRAE
ncbi:hypothetical protein SIN8267_02468 [Sinobacterium norvegicum]|uniref:Lipoprotein n=1 Tax=Sinobacterium norvegicum TaxID=1641715 RepID=A0ABM9AGL1_9GAMM|nr:DUF6491 family protein [Sinobacterium norvegicum]CAH0992349.1 hypothetical protein SIN8267_02468 [Sinobacterium norvegicum]